MCRVKYINFLLLVITLRNMINNTLAGLLLLAVLFHPSTIVASKIFVSNNKRIISSSEAYKRMSGKVQFKLVNNTITTLQNYHFQQGRMDGECLGCILYGFK